jgi:AraC-like DNA-binding protein
LKALLAQVIVAEEDVARATRARERRLFAEVFSIGADYRQPSREATGDLILDPIITTVERADVAAKQLRMEEARRLLRETKTSVIDVALEVGYTDPSHFARLFRRETGLPPSEYRRKR